MTGASGQVGLALRELRPDWRFARRAELDVTDADDVREQVSRCDAVVHLAAFTDVDRCETEPERAWAVNARGTKNVADAAADRGARLVYLSTDYVFDGRKRGEYDEQDRPGPLNHYGRSKLEGERHASGAGGVVVRTSWLFGDGRNFVRSIVAAARERDELEVVDDQRGRPTAARDLATALAALVDDSEPGIVHVAGDGEACTWADLAEEALRCARSPVQVKRIDSATYAARARRVIAPRPANSVLALGKARSLSLPLFEWRRSLRRYVETLSA